MPHEPVIAGLARDTAAALAAAERENERLRQRSTLLEEQVRSLLALQAITTTISSELALGPLLRRVAAAALRMTATQAAALFLLDETGQALIARAVENERTAADSGAFALAGGNDETAAEDGTLPRLPLGSGLAGWVAANGSFALIGDVERDARFAPELFVADAGVLGIAPVALLAVPLVHGETLMGVLEVAHGPGATGLDATSLDLVQTLAAAAATSVANIRLYRELRDERDQVMATQEGERRRLAHELRGGPGQQLAQLVMALEYAGQLARHDPRQLTVEVQRLHEQAQGISSDLRRLAAEVRPPAIDTEPDGLAAALGHYVERFSSGPGPSMHTLVEYPDRLGPAVEMAVFTVIQEAVANVFQHAQARSCWIELRETPERLVATVRDDGIGFDMRQVETEYESRGGWGLLGMLDRAAHVGGKLTVASQPGRGTAISLDVPRAAP